MRLPFRRSLRVQLVAILAIALTPLLALSIIQGTIEFEDERLKQIDRLYTASSLATDDLESALERALGIGAAIAGRPSSFLTDAEGCDRALARIAETDIVVSNIAITDATGRVRCAGLGTDLDFSAGGLAWFEDIQARGGPLFTRVQPGDLSRRPIMLIAHPFEIAGEFAGAVAIAVDAVAALRLVDENYLPPEATLAFFNHEGVFTLGGQRLPFETLPPDLLAEALAAEDTIIVQQPEAAPGRTLTFSPMVERRFGTVLLTPGPAYSAWTGYDLAGTILIPFLMWTLAIVCVWIAIDRFVLRWLTYLRRIARLYGSGRLDIDPSRAEKAPAEVEELATTLAKMAASLEEQRSELESAVEQRTALLREIHHRVKNNLQVIVSLLNLQAGRLPDGSGREALFEARRRINALALVHRSLYEAEDLRQVEMRPFLRELLHYVSDASKAAEQAVAVEVESEDIEFEPDYAVPLALFVTEAANNAFKHAFEDRMRGTIRVSLARLGADRYEIAVADDGSGLAEGAGEGTGSTLMSAFAQQMGGDLVREKTEAGGTRVGVRFSYAASARAGTAREESAAQH